VRTNIDIPANIEIITTTVSNSTNVNALRIVIFVLKIIVFMVIVSKIKVLQIIRFGLYSLTPLGGVKCITGGVAQRNRRKITAASKAPQGARLSFPVPFI
jgi:hypothetical protein